MVRALRRAAARRRPGHPPAARPQNQTRPPPPAPPPPGGPGGGGGGPGGARPPPRDRDTLRLLAHNPFPDAPPVHVRARLYRYRYTTWRELRATGAWWHRTPLREYLPPTRLRKPAGGP
ncbi:lipase maturation factor family protein [Streptomyces sp. NPDC058861]|uniref:lipase maturation factor family protein n=1 Tax=Streptomyces sp. NPDC058861 TaxID=3346653 RepID=UPI0036896470